VAFQELALLPGFRRGMQVGQFGFSRSGSLLVIAGGGGAASISAQTCAKSKRVVPVGATPTRTSKK
jgi:hypothetical protein